jgi:hypothetical protein
MINDFEIGMKVYLDNEFGIVINSEFDKIPLYGIIRWDTTKENDLEDWRGQFGTFINNGGKIINVIHKFIHIDNEGNLIN